ncbi:MAG: MBL fold metallo-hydrolase [Candidatus Thorarchaeota archaeon]
MVINKVEKNLNCINLDFINTWVYKNDKLCFLVDPGPAVTINLLKKSLDQLKIKRNDLNYILLTHPHIDHAGGVGKLLTSFPQAKIICHPRGIKHLIDPKKLWEGSLKVLGRAAEYYGRIKPVSEDRIEYKENIEGNLIRAIETLGHSPHHQSYPFKHILFVGEACGHNYPTEKEIHIRPATPPIFDYDLYTSSIQKLIDLKLSDFKICFPHWGIRKNAALIINIAYNQINTWLRVINSYYDKRNQSNFLELVFNELKIADKIFGNLELLSQEKQIRDPITIRQSVAGIVGYIEKKIKES